LNNGGTILALLQTDESKYSTEYLYSTDSGLLGARGLYNFGPDPRQTNSDTTAAVRSGSGHEPVHGRFSAGAEVYYGLLNKSGGMSTGIRFTTLPQHRGFPYTMTLTLNPLMGNLSSTYAVKAGRNLALCSKFDFNFYSYESDVRLGCELWRRNTPRLDSADAFESGVRASSSQADSDASPIQSDPQRPLGESVNEKLRPSRLTQNPFDPADEANAAVLKARVDQNWNIGLLWEGRMKDLLFTLGASFDLKRREQIIRSVGVEVQYSS
jgi:mitochondrial distribution and morphology protein 10